MAGGGTAATDNPLHPSGRPVSWRVAARGSGTPPTVRPSWRVTCASHICVVWPLWTSSASERSSSPSRATSPAGSPRRVSAPRRPPAASSSTMHASCGRRSAAFGQRAGGWPPERIRSHAREPRHRSDPASRASRSGPIRSPERLPTSRGRASSSSPALSSHASAAAPDARCCSSTAHGLARAAGARWSAAATATRRRAIATSGAHRPAISRGAAGASSVSGCWARCALAACSSRGALAGSGAELRSKPPAARPADSAGLAAGLRAAGARSWGRCPRRARLSRR